MYPERLRQNDLVGICAPASPIRIKELEKGITFLKQLGLRVRLAPNIAESNGYLAGTDAQRKQDFLSLLEDPSIKAIIFARGGYGTARFADDIDFALLRKNPKIIWGFSDITFLHTLIYAQTKLITFHGPMVMTAGREEFDEISQQAFQQLFTPRIRSYTESISPLRVIVPGEAKAPLIGGNLSLLVSTLGTKHDIDVRQKILFIEEVNERIYKIDGMLNQLKLANKLRELAGIVVGDFHNTICMQNGRRLNETETKEQLDALLEHYFGNLQVPVISGFKIGHCFPHFAIPHGAQGKLTTANKTLEIEAGVK